VAEPRGIGTKPQTAGSRIAKALAADRELIFMEIGRGYRFTGVLRTNIVLESCRPMRAKRAVWPNFLRAGGIRSNAVSIRSRARTSKGFAIWTPMRK
jgi:hypothetical protein